ncbi:MAG: YdeI/OmpD-associated family protein [Saprospiraceae bacterium]|nr:YdeI/OmpD-associated family protein [Saprospiraceae bacterium]
MGNKDPRIDAYIDKSNAFAKPILIHLRQLIHQAVPEINETIKWSFTAFDYKGPLCTMAAFKEHISFDFWKAELLKDPEKHLQPRKNHGGNAMGHLGKIQSLQDLPPDEIIIAFLLEAKKLNDEQIKLPPKPKKEWIEIPIPEEFTTALQLHKKAQTEFEKFSPSHKREYLHWINEAKTTATRDKRIQTAMEWISEGKSRNWKYEKK